MKKAIAFAVLSGACGLAVAQSSVTLYGVADAGIRLIDPKPNNTTSTIELAPGVQSGNRWGLRGNEDLGAGWRAIFQLESGFTIDNGTSAQGGRLFGRWAYVGVAGPAGELRLGRIEFPASDLMPAIDPFGTGFSDAGISATFTATDISRSDNMAIYKTPTFAGINMWAGHSFNRAAAENAGRSTNQYQTTAAIDFKGGPFYGFVSYDSINNPAANVSNQKMLTLGASVDFKVVRVRAAWAKEDNVFTGATIANSPESNSYMLGLSVPIGDATLLGSYQRRNDDAAANNDVRVFAFGATYALSRRTNLYTYFADTAGSGGLDKDNAATALATRAEFNRRQVALGMRHRF